MGRKPSTAQFYVHTSAVDMYYVLWETGETAVYSFVPPFRSGGNDREWSPVKTLRPLLDYVELGVLKPCSLAHLNKHAQQEYHNKYGGMRG